MALTPGEVTPEVARKTWRTLEPFHGLVYFAKEATAAYEALGIMGFDGYFASRAAPMGAVSAPVVEATFFNFHPSVVRHSIPAAWDKATPAHVLEARHVGIDAALRRCAGPDMADSPEVARAAELARIAAESANVDGRTLAAAHKAMPWPDAPHIALWHAISILREHRGDGHIAMLVGSGISGAEALVLHGATGEVPSAALQGSRQWPAVEWAAAVAALVDRGLVDEAGSFTDEGRQLRETIEGRTDVLAVQPWTALGAEACEELRALVRPWSKAILASGSFGLR